MQDWPSVKAMEFFVEDGMQDRYIWGRHNDNVSINKIGEFFLEAEVQFLIPGTSGI